MEDENMNNQELTADEKASLSACSGEGCAPRTTTVDATPVGEPVVKDALHIGIDVGSTTVKLAILDENNQVKYSVYRRHHADVRATIVEVLSEAAEGFGDERMTIAITGSGGLLLAQWLGIEFVQEVIASKTAVEHFHPQNRCGHRARRRGREDHLLRKRHRAAHERHLRGRYGRIHRPDGGTFEHRCGRPERACAECDHHLSHRLALRRVREDRRAAAFERGRAQGGHRRVHLPVRRDADHLRPRMRPTHPRLRGVFGRSAAIPSRTAQTLLRDARARRGAPHRARQRAPVRGKRLRHRGRGERDRARREAL